MYLPERDENILRSIARYSLTNRLILELSLGWEKPINSPQSLLYTMKRLEKGGLIRKNRLLFSNEYYYYLTKQGAKEILSEDELERTTKRVFSATKENGQRHEFLISQFMVKFEIDTRKLNIPIEFFVREGQFVATIEDQNQIKKIVPDGTIILRIKNSYRVYFLEVDRSTERVRTRSKFNTNSFSEKIHRYTKFFNLCRNHEIFKELDIKGFQVITVCLTKERMFNLLKVAKIHNKKRMFCFTHIRELIERGEKRGDWIYKKANILRADKFYFPQEKKAIPLFSKLNFH